jgi:small subunit ribosomal protein S21
MQVTVNNNNIDGAVKALKKKLAQDGFFAEIKERRYYEKPSVARKKKRAKAEKRRRKSLRRL